MGCGASVPDSPTGGEPMQSASDGKVMPFSAASLAMFSLKPAGKTIDQEFNDDKRGTSHALNDKWGLSKANPMSIRYWTTSGFPKAGDMQPASGAISVGDNDNLTLLFGSYYPLKAPVAKQKACGSVAVVCPVVRAVDMYVTIDGEERTDGHICCGDVSNDRAASIKHADAKVAQSGEEDALRSLLEAGPPGGAPWATLVSKELNDEFFIHLPLIVQDNIDDNTLPESETYGGALVSKFSALLKEAGAGTHEITVRLAPRGMIQGGDVCDGYGGYSGGGTSGVRLSMTDYYEDATFKALIDGPLKGQHPSADVPGLCATFSLTVPDKLCQGGGGERKAPEFVANFSRDLAEHCDVAHSLAATGPPRDAVSKLLGSVTHEMVAHIIIPESNLAGGITPMNTQEGREAGTRFFATALFYSADAAAEDGLGAMVKFVCAKYERRHHKAVSNPKWESEGTYGNSRELCAAMGDHVISLKE